MTSTANDIVISSLDERRQAIFARVTAQLDARGTPINSNPEFLALVERWIQGAATLTDVTEGYSEIRRKAIGRQVSPIALADEGVEARASQEKLLAELENIIGVFEQSELPPLKN